MIAPDALTTRQIHDFLRAHHANSRPGAGEWAFFEELATETGGMGAQRIDAFAMHLWPSMGHRRIAYEVKISRSDFARERKKPAKRRLALLYSNLFYFATPRGLLKIEEVPAECGLIEFDAEWSPLTKVAAPWRESVRPSWGFMASLVRQADRLAEKRVEGTVRRQFDARAGELQLKAERLEILAGQLREQRRALDDEWEKCKATQRESGLTPPWSLPVAVRQ